MRVGILDNLQAGGGGAFAVRSWARRRDDLRVVESADLSALDEACRVLEQDGCDVWLINGGDGTLQHVLTALLRDPDRTALPALAPLRGGRTNMTSRDLGADRKPVRGAERLLDALASGDLAGHRVERPVLRVESARRGAPLYGFFFGAGLIYRAIRWVHQHFPPRHGQGVAGAGLMTATLLGRMLGGQREGLLAPDKCSVWQEEHLIGDGEQRLVIATSLDRLFLGLEPFWAEGTGAVRLTALASDTPSLARATPAILRGRRRAEFTPENGFTSVRGEAIDLRIDCGFTIDGELFAPLGDETIRIGADRRIGFLRA
ncbi:MAG: diacylglycerol kinase family protein [Myxococcota bacterium]